MVSSPLLRRLLRVSKAHGLLHGIKAGSFENDWPFSPLLNTCLANDTILK
jgi:hypothetical protein